MTKNDLERKSATITTDCFEMLNEAMVYLEETALVPKQAEILKTQFFKIIDLLEVMPGIGTIYENGMRKFPLGKFRYNIFYRELETEIEILGIWHTSRGTDFEDEA